jgi:hypothetical protein
MKNFNSKNFLTQIFITVVAVFCYTNNTYAQDVTVYSGDGYDIQNAIDEVSAAGGGTVSLEAGTYILYESLEMSSDITLEGVGTATRLELPSGANYAMIVDDGTEPCENMTIRNMLLNGNIPEDSVSYDSDYTSSQNSSLGIYFDAYSEETYHTNVVIENVEIYHTVNACHLKGVNGGYWDNVYFHHNGMFFWPGHNSYLRRVQNYVVQNSLFEDSYNGSGINCSWSDSLVFSSCEVSRSGGRGIRCAASDGFYVYDCVITDCGAAGIIANSESSTHVSGVDFQGNCVTGCASEGIYTSSGASGTVSDNNSYNNETDYSLSGSITESNNESDESQACEAIFTCGDFDAFLTIEAEDYCDMSGVDTEDCDEGEENVGWIDDDDWIMFSDVEFGDGADSVKVRVASKYTGGTIELRLGSTTGTLIGTVSVPVTGGWQTWTTETVDVSGASGTQDLYLVFTEGGINVNWIMFVESVSCATFSTIEAEDFDDMSGIVDEGESIGYIQDGDWAMYSDVDLTCAASIEVYASSENDGGEIEVRLGSTSGELIGTIEIEGTGSWDTWETSSVNITSVSGTYDVYLVFSGGSGYLFNLDWLEFSTSLKSATIKMESVDNYDIKVYPNPVENLLYIENASGAKVEVFTISGSLLNQTILQSNNETIDFSIFAPGSYFVKLTTSNGTVVTNKVLKN